MTITAGAAPTSAPDAAPRELDAFISYSRADSTFVSVLTEELLSLGRTPWIDTDAIPAGAPWRHELGTAIEAAVAFVFIVSPASVESRECLYELARAAELGKRLLPVVLQPAPLPPALASIQWIDAGDAAATARAIAAAIDSDYEWARTHTDYLARALKWERTGSASLLPRGDDLDAAEAWLARQAEGHDPRPTELQTRFVATARARARRRQRRLMAGALVAVAVFAAIAAVAMVQRRSAVVERNHATSRALAANAIVNLESDALASLTLATRAHEIDASPETIAALRRSLTASHLRTVLRGRGSGMTQSAVSGDRIVTGDQAGHVLLWQGGARRALPGLTARVELLAFRAGGQQIVGVDTEGHARVWRVADGATVGSFRTGFDVGSAAVDARGDRLATATVAGARVWSLPSGRLVARLEPTTPDAQGLAQFKRYFNKFESFGKRPLNYTKVALSPDGRWALTGEAGGAVRRWDVERGTDAVIGRFPPVIFAVAFSPDGKLALATDAQDTHLFAASGRTLRTFPGARAAFSPDSRWVVTGDSAEKLGSPIGVVEVRDARSGRRTRRMQDSGAWVDTITFSADGELVATGSWDTSVRVWERASGATRATLDARHLPGTDVDFAPDGSVITVGSDGNARVWDPTGTTRIVVDRDRSVGSLLVRVRFDRTGSRLFAMSQLATAGIADSRTGIISDPGQCAQRAAFNCLEFGLRNVTGSIWNGMYSRAGFLAHATPEHPTRADQERALLSSPRSADLSPSGTLVAVGTWGGALTLVDARTGVLTARIVSLHESPQIVRFSPDGRQLLAAGTRSVWLLDSTTLRVEHRLRQNADVNDADFADGGATIVTAGDDGLMRRWRVGGGQALGSRRFDNTGLLGIAGGPRGLIAIADGDNASLWDGRHELTLQGQPPQVSTVALSPDGEFVAAGGSTPVIHVWERRTGRPVATFDGSGTGVAQIAFSPDGRRIATAGNDGIARIFDCEICAPPDALLTLAKRRVGDQLSTRQQDTIVRNALR